MAVCANADGVRGFPCLRKSTDPPNRADRDLGRHAAINRTLRLTDRDRRNDPLGSNPLFLGNPAAELGQ